MSINFQPTAVFMGLFVLSRSNCSVHGPVHFVQVQLQCSWACSFYPGPTAVFMSQFFCPGPTALLHCSTIHDHMLSPPCWILAVGKTLPRQWVMITCKTNLEIEDHAVGHLVVTTAVLWQMMCRIKDWFIHLLILSTVYEHDNRKQLYTNQISSRWKKVNKMRHFTVIADLNVWQ